MPNVTLPISFKLSVDSIVFGSLDLSVEILRINTSTMSGNQPNTFIKKNAVEPCVPNLHFSTKGTCFDDLFLVKNLFKFWN